MPFLETVSGKLLMTFGVAMVPVLELRGTAFFGPKIAWTGALAASVLDIRMRSALPAILLGLIAAGGITTAVTVGLIHLF